jgi:hypothetical protein
MSDKVQEDTVTEVVEETPVTETSQPQPKILKIHGKEFDISTSEGFIHAKAWGEAISSLVGRQGQEIGSLRKFVTERKPSKDESELLSKVKELRSLGEHDQADTLLFDHAKSIRTQADAKLEKERANDRTWEAYFDTRADVVKLFGKETVRKVSENALEIYESDDPFKLLDQFWTPKLPQADPKVVGPADKEVVEKPPVTLSGGSAKRSKVEAKSDAKPKATLDEILDARAIKRR